MTERIVLSVAATVESQDLRIGENDKAGLKNQCIEGLHNLPSATAENEVTVLSDTK